MNSNSLGHIFTITVFGESHGTGIGVIIDGVPAGLPIDVAEIQEFVNLRRPGTDDIVTQRQEEDKVEILSGVFNGRTTGAPLTLFARNMDVDSRHYELYRRVPRPGHADYPAKIKYKGYNDWRGSGRFSGRITLAYVMAGAIAKKLLSDALGIEVMAYTKQIGTVKIDSIDIDKIRKNRYRNYVRCPDPKVAMKMREEIVTAKLNGDSVGGVIECIVDNVPVGIGEPIFNSVESELSKAMFSIPAVKGIEFGLGFGFANSWGSEVNDEYAIRNGKIVARTNNSGGILGGLTTGMPIVFRVVLKPTASIAKVQKSVDMEEMKETELVVKGRHDPCIVPRAVPVVEGLTAVVLTDLALQGGVIKKVL